MGSILAEQCRVGGRARENSVAVELCAPPPRAAHDAEADAQGAWSGALAAVDSVTRATGVAELRVLTATALASLGRVEDARPIVRTLEQ